MQIDLDRESAVSLHRQIADAIKRSILLKSLPHGYRLPSQRRMASWLGVNRATVVTAYRELRADGLIHGRAGRGTLVAPAESEDSQLPTRMRWCTMNREDARTCDGVVRELFENSLRKDVICMSLGIPAAELMPLGLLEEIRARLIRDFGTAPFLPTPPHGLEALRRVLAERLRARGVVCAPAQMMLAAGAQQAIELVARAYLEPGDTVCVEEPCYSSALRMFRAVGARLISVPVDQDGLQTEVLASHLRRRQPKLMYVRPTFQNPSGATMSLARRQQLLELAHRHDVPIIEHDAFFDLRYTGEFVPPLKALDRGRFVIYIDSFPRVISPEFGVAALVAAPEVMRKLAAEKCHLAIDANPLGEWMLAEFAGSADYDRHVEMIRSAYAARLAALLEGLEADGGGLSWTTPRGGLYLWCRLPRGLDEKALRQAAFARGVGYLPGANCSVTGEAADWIRLSFSLPSPSEISLGAARLMDAVRAASRGAAPRAVPQVSAASPAP